MMNIILLRYTLFIFMHFCAFLAMWVRLCQLGCATNPHGSQECWLQRPRSKGCHHHRDASGALDSYVKLCTVHEAPSSCDMMCFWDINITRYNHMINPSIKVEKTLCGSKLAPHGLCEHKCMESSSRSCLTLGRNAASKDSTSSIAVNQAWSATISTSRSALLTPPRIPTLHTRCVRVGATKYVVSWTCIFRRVGTDHQRKEWILWLHQTS